MDLKNLFSLKDKISLITGACGILGTHFSKALGAFGSHLVLVDLNEDKLNSLTKEIETSYLVKCLPVVCDITDEKSVQKLHEKVKEHFGTLDILINNAATKTEELKNFFAHTQNYSMDTWNKVMDVNVNAQFLIAKTFSPFMLEKKSGSMIQISSIYGILGPDSRIYEGSYYLGMKINTPAIYSASKAAVIGLTKYLACEWGSYNVRVNCLVPGGVESGQNKTFSEKYSQRVPLNRMATPMDLIGSLIFLASDASSYVTGQILMVDGGLSAW